MPQPFPTPSTYAVFDPIAVGTDPHIDACELIRRILEEGKSQAAGSYSVGAPDLLSETGWPHRRLNPALSLVIAQVDDRHVSKVLDGEFAARSFFVSPSDELALERFLKRVGG